MRKVSRIFTKCAFMKSAFNGVLKVNTIVSQIKTSNDYIFYCLVNRNYLNKTCSAIYTLIAKVYFR